MKVFKFENLFYISDYELHGLFIKNNKLYQKGQCCQCGGKGYISYFQYYKEGICFKCLGSGIQISHIKSYKTQKGAERSIQRQEYNQVQKELYNESIKQKIKDTFKTIYVVDPKINTNQYKDILKDNCVWSGKVWYTNNNKLTDFNLIPFDITDYINSNIDDICIYRTNKYQLYFLSDKINELVKPLLDRINSEKYNYNFNKYNVNDRYIFDIQDILSMKAYESPYGSVFYYVFIDSENHKIKYKTSRYLKDIKGTYKATIKSIDENSISITRLKKCG